MKKNIVYMFADQLAACALKLYGGNWFDSERRVVANAFGPLPHPETGPDWSLL